ncbi:MAG: FG-GAP-like repeat-containing protein, partial [Bacteroidota bacterium]
MNKLIFLALIFVPSILQAQITSTFDTDADGWTFFNGATGSSSPGIFNSVGGNPGGYTSFTYSSNIGIARQSWIAPPKFLGNHIARSLGMNLVFSLQQSASGTNSSTSGDVRIEGGGITLIFSLQTKPAVSPTWSVYSLRLDETQPWRIGSTLGSIATRAQIIRVLSNVTAIEIRGTYVTNAAYTSGLDNVVLEQRTFSPPVISSMTSLAALPGTSIAINGNNFSSVIANNSVYFGKTIANITSATTTSLTVTVPSNAQFGPVTVVNRTSGLSKQSTQIFNPLFAGGGRIIPSSFKSNFTFDVTGGFGGLSMADIDGDGWTDLVVARRDNTGILVYRNLGLGGSLSTGSFATPINFPTLLFGTNGSGLTTVDFDNDGKIDMATSGWTGGPGAFATFRNISTPGNIAFETVEIWNGLSDESPVNAAADIDGDGLIDLTSGEGSSPGGTWIIQNISTPGNIEFGVSQSFFGNNSNQGTTLGDLNGDGKPEFIHKIQNVGNQQDIYTNTSLPGSISFDTSFTLPFAIQGSMIVFDFNQDGKNDLAWKDGNSSNDIRVRINTNSGGPLSAADFATEVIFDSETSNFGGASLGDINGDGKPDILATDSDTPAIFESAFSGGAFDGNAFVPAHRFPGVGAFTYPIAPQAADLNGDGKPDMVVGFTNSSPNKIAIYGNQNVATPKISVTTVSPLAAPIGSTVTITGSGFSPNTSENSVYFGAVQAASVLTASSTSLTVLVPIGASYAPVSVRVGELSSTYHLPFKTTFSPGVTFNNTHFAPPISSALANAMYHIDVADIDTDGKPDIAAEINTQRPIFFRNTHLLGNITTSSLTNAGTTAAAATDAKFLDVDGNGLPELVGMQGQFFQNNSTPGSISFGTGATGGPFYTGTGSAFADFNLDGKMDFAAIETNRLVVLENRSLTGTISSVGAFGSFANSVSFAKPSFDGGLVAADFDADGYADVIALTPSTNNYSVFRNNKAPRINSSSFAVRVDVATGINPLKIYTGDFDSDGKLDFVVHYGTGANAATVSVFHNQSTPGSIIFNRVDLANPDPQPVARLTVADLDGDGKPEIVTTHESANRFSIFKNIHTTGPLTTASFASPFNTNVTAPRGINTIDLNGDSKLEIVLTQNASGGQLLVYQNLIANPTITSFLPNAGPIGTEVVISGTNFSVVPTDNDVRFNGISAYVISSTASSITAIVPPGATAGPISVTVTNNTATSSSNFNVSFFNCLPSTPLGGSLDPSFNADVQWNVPFPAVKLQSNGKIVASTPDVLIGGIMRRGLLRFNADGTLDGAFAVNTYDPSAKQLIVQPDDKIIVFDPDEFASIKRLNAEGTNDPAFVGPVFDNSGTYATVVGPLELQSDGKVLYSASNTFDGIDELVRLNVNGSRDFSFVAPSDLDALVIRQQTDGKIVVGGGFGIIRLDASGNVDASFISSAMDGAVNDLIIQPDGKIVIIGTFAKVQGVPTRNIARLLANGNVDLTFKAGNGFSQYAGAQPNVVKRLPNGQLLVAGEFTSYNDVSRNRLVILLPDGGLDCTFDPLVGPSNELLDFAVQPDNKILIVGSFTSYDGTPKNSIARVNGLPASCLPSSERAALIALYNSTNGASWTNNTNWLNPNESTWHGVVVVGCSVEQINLPNNNLSGSMPIEIGNLPNLKQLDLWNNSVTGTIPAALTNLTNLQRAYLFNNQLTGSIPATIGNMTSLRNLRLDGNRLTGSLPSSLFTIVNLRELELGNNQLSGTLPAQVGNLINLQKLGLSGNQFTGSIPTEIGNLSNLTSLILGINQFSGTLPSSIGNLTNLVAFSVFNNQLSGQVPASLANLVNLNGLGLSVNQFTGDVPAGIGLIPNLNDVSLRDNDFTSIPVFVSNAFTSLLVYGNKLNFGHLEPNITKIGFVYSPQDNLPGGSVSTCAGSTLTINFSTPGTANQYQWFKDAVLIPGATSATFTKVNAVAADAGNYTVRVTNTIVSGLTLTSDPFIISISTLPASPTASAVNVCPGNTATLTASGGTNGQYRWYNVPTGGTAISGETSNTFVTATVSVPSTFYVSLSNGTCESARAPIIVTPTNSACAPPTITPTSITVPVGDNTSLDLTKLITITSGTLDVASISVSVPPPSGAATSIVNGVLTLDYKGIAFTGKESLTIRACTTNGNCATQQIEIEVAGDVIIYNALSPNGANPTFVIEFIELIPDAKNNIVTIFDRWQNEVWRGENYDN